jgi:multiple sugar transport system ATP-binding protein
VVGISEHLGSDTFLRVQVEGLGMITVRTGGDVALHHGDTVFLTPQPGKMHRFGADGKAMA